MANMNKGDSDSKTHKTVINVRTLLFSGRDKDIHVCSYRLGYSPKRTHTHTQTHKEAKGTQNVFFNCKRKRGRIKKKKQIIGLKTEIYQKIHVQFRFTPKDLFCCFYTKNSMLKPSFFKNASATSETSQLKLFPLCVAADSLSVFWGLKHIIIPLPLRTGSLQQHEGMA